MEPDPASLHRVAETGSRPPNYRTLAGEKVRERARDLATNLARWLERRNDGWVVSTCRAPGVRAGRC